MTFTHVTITFCVMETKLWGCIFGLLQRGIDCTQVFISQFLEIGWLVLWIWVERESCLWIFMVILKLKNKLRFFLLNVVTSISHPMKNHSTITCTTLMQNAYAKGFPSIYLISTLWIQRLKGCSHYGGCSSGSGFYFYGNGIMNVILSHNHLLPPSSRLLRMVNHPWDDCSRSCGIRELQGQGPGRMLRRQPKVNKDILKPKT